MVKTHRPQQAPPRDAASPNAAGWSQSAQPGAQPYPQQPGAQPYPQQAQVPVYAPDGQPMQPVAAQPAWQATQAQDSEPLETEDARTYNGLGMLLGGAGFVLCCMPLGLLGILFPLSVLRRIDSLSEPSQRDNVKRQSLIAAGICATTAALSVFGYTFALLAGCN
ncbi:MAG: hypothetical protein RBU37_13080 [Myxococcota bacterium]|jgi:hypothetical protein|nr:hypothetical protein [Myxococcota bacterium]